MPKKIPGIRDIAKLAGVSIGTVDRVLHNRGRVSVESKKKILAIINEVNYKPNLLARSLVNRKKITIALIIPDYKLDEYWKQSQKGIEAALQAWNSYEIELLIFRFELEDTQSFLKATAKAFSAYPAGIIFVPIFYDRGLSFLKKCEEIELPVVMFNTYLPASQPLCFIGTDSVQSGVLAAELMDMITLNGSKMVILHFDEDLKNSAHMLEKEKGFRSYFSSSKRFPDLLTAVLNNTRHQYQKQLEKLFQENKIGGVFVSTSKAHRIGEFLEQQKMGGVKVIGYDLIPKNVELLKNGWIHFLINQNPRRQTELSINTLCNFLVNKTIPESQILFPLEVVTRVNLKSYLESDIH